MVDNYTQRVRITEPGVLQMDTGTPFDQLPFADILPRTMNNIYFVWMRSGSAKIIQRGFVDCISKLKEIVTPIHTYFGFVYSRRTHVEHVRECSFPRSY